MDTEEAVLRKMCADLLRQIGGDGSLLVEEHDYPQLPGDPGGRIKTYVTFANIKHPTCGKTPVESLAWMAAQAISMLPSLNPAVLSAYDTLVEKGIKIPTRDEYERALVKMVSGTACTERPSEDVG